MLRNLVIENFGSYQGFSGLDEKNNFKKMNIIYGANYSGKTTLSRIFALLKNKDDPENYLNPSFNLIFDDEEINSSNFKCNSKELLVFNKDFINENLSFLVFNDYGSGSIKSFDAVVIGKDQIAINSRIDDLLYNREFFDNIEVNVNHILDLIVKDRGDVEAGLVNLKKEINNKLTEKARELEASGLKNKARTYRKPNLESDISEILNKNSILKKTLTEEEISRKIKDMNVSEKPSINFISKENDIKTTIDNHILSSVEKLKEIVEKTPIKELDGFFKDWSIAGYHLHKEHNKDYCQFCGGDLRESILAEYEKYINRKEETLKRDINDLISKQHNIAKALQSQIDLFVDPNAYFYDSFKVKYETSLEHLKSKAFEFLEGLSILDEKFKEKLEDTTLKVIFDSVALEKNARELIESYIKVVSICNENDRFSRNLTIEQSSLKLEILEQRIIEFLIEFEWNVKQKNIKDFEMMIEEFSYPELCNTDRIYEIKNIKINIDREIKKLNAQKSTQLAASELVNKFLNNFFGHESLSLIPLDEEGDQEKFKIIRNGYDAFNLSEGEITLVAFCYFIALIYNLKNLDKLKDNIIYIDDPISSLDSNNIFYIYSLIENVICKGHSYKQLFISTHNLEFFKYLRKLSIPEKKTVIKSCSDSLCTSTKKNKSEDLSFYFVRKVNNVSELTVLPNYLRKYNTEFNYLFSQIWNCAHGSSNLSPDQIYNFSNNMRKFFEVYNYFKYPTDYNKAAFREKFFDAENHLNHFKLVDRIANEYSHAEEIFDRTMRPITSQEMIDASQFILRQLKANDETQYDALVQSIKDLRDEVD